MVYFRVNIPYKNKMKIIAMYLPQFHIVKENSEWWGENYTDWVAVQEAEAYYEAHNQPHIPLGGKYYDLIDKKTMKWQAELMQSYGIDGVCLYHYWFKDGRRILEKPAENLLKWKEIEMPFCFYWDNATWARSWSKLKGFNDWNIKFERDSNGKEILLEQDYGSEKKWREHFEYLLPFFKDPRYIRIKNKILFMIYKTDEMYCFEEMLEKWNVWIKDEGFEGIYCICVSNYNQKRSGMDARLCHEPAAAFGKIRKSILDKSGVKRFSYDEIWQNILKRRRYSYKCYYTGFTGYDDTPRRGKEGIVVEGKTPEKFQQYFAELLAKSEVVGNEVTFLNAWNEWGEGMYLEPDEEEGYAYLQAVSDAKKNYRKYIPKYEEIEAAYSIEAVKEIENLEDTNKKYQFLLRVLDKWLTLKQKGICLEEYFKVNGINTIAIYGMGIIGKKLLIELDSSKVNVVFAIDQFKEKVKLSIPVYSLEDELPIVDAIVLTMEDYMKLEQKLKQRTKSHICIIENILEDSLKMLERKID